MSIPTGHKVAVRAIDAGQPVRKVGLVIGWAAAPIAAGDHVHDHNLTTKGTLPPAVGGRPGPASSAAPGRMIRGYVRPDGRVGTRNHLLVITTVNCSATVARAVAAEAGRLLPDGVDGVTALLHASGCGLPAHGPQIDRLRRVLAGYATNPNTAGAVVIGLGCEVNQLDAFLEATGLAAGPTLETVVIQDAGGTRAAIDAGVAGALRVAGRVATVEREEVPARQSVLGVQCGGSDGFSAVTANPALGRAADLLVADGATVLLSETPELSGTEEEMVAPGGRPVGGRDDADDVRLVARLRGRRRLGPRRQPVVPGTGPAASPTSSRRAWARRRRAGARSSAMSSATPNPSAGPVS